jgi:hypothetical protein
VLAEPNSFGFLSGAGEQAGPNSATEISMAQRSNKKQAPDRDASNTIKDPDDWKTGDEPMTGAQESYLNTLASEAGEEVEQNLTKAEASKRIDELREKTGRGEP